MTEPKYIKLKKELVKLIDNITKNGDNRMPAEKNITEKYNVSRHTVRRALKILQEEGFLYSVKGSGTYIKKRKSETIKHTVGVITTYENYVFSEIIKSIDNKLSQNGIEMILGVTHNRAKREGEIIENMLSKNIGGFIVEPSKSAFPSPNIELFRSLRSENKPIIMINGYYRDLDTSNVLLDDIDGGYKLTKHLIEKGHRNISCVLKVDDIQGHRRYEGYLKALKEYDIPLDEDLIDWYTTENIDEITSSKGLKEKIKGSTAVICYNDQAALRINRLLLNIGLKVPEDISIVSFDNSKFAKLAGLELTCINYPGKEIGMVAGEMMANNIIYGINNKKILMPAEMIKRNSVKTLKGDT